MVCLKTSLICLVLVASVKRSQAQDDPPGYPSLSANISVAEAVAGASSAKHWMQMQNSGRTSGSGCSNDNCVESCEQDWEKNGDHCYYWSTEKKNWTDSEDFCQKEGGHLASVTSKVLEGINRTEHLGGIWIGGNDLEVDGVWRWTDCSPWEFTIWGPGEPNNWGGVDDCLHHHIMDWGHKWNDGLCGFESKFLCSKSICSEPTTTVSAVPGGSVMWKPASISLAATLLLLLLVFL